MGGGGKERHTDEYVRTDWLRDVREWTRWEEGARVTFDSTIIVFEYQREKPVCQMVGNQIFSRNT